MDAGLAVILPDDLGAEGVELIEHDEELVARLGLGVEADARAAGRKIDDQPFAALAADLDAGRPQDRFAREAAPLLDLAPERADLRHAVLEVSDLGINGHGGNLRTPPFTLRSPPTGR